MLTSSKETNLAGDDIETNLSGIASEKGSVAGELPAGPSTAAAPTDALPDGGAEAWMVVAGAWCTSFCSFGWINSIGVFQDYYEKNTLKAYSPSTISWIVSLESFFLLCMTPIVGKIYDTYGPRYIILAGSFFHVFGLMMASISKEYYQLLLSQGICSSLGASALFLPSFNSVAGYFNKNRAAAFGVIATGSSTGGVIFPIMVSRLINEVGFGWAMRTSAFVILGLLIFANFAIRSRIQPQPKSLSLKEFILPFKEPPFTLVVCGNFFFGFGVFIPVTYIVVQATADGMGQNLAQYLVPILNAASLFGRLAAGIFADKLGRFNIYAVACYLTGVLILVLWIPAKGNAALIIFAIFCGFTSGAYASLGPAVVAQVSPLKDIGIRTGLFFAVGSIAALTSGPIAGAILQHSSDGSFIGVKVFGGVLCIAGAAAMTAGRIYKTGFKLMAKF
ncbi:putative MFS transporter [Xylogone sp. PMI_703]|nr:putative MFS transporter [Xylogone sp. PMI_703]